ncbi:ribose-5-phosphate isomerase RpiA [Cohnella sp. NL03-T5]|uniref:Ribose-5-phosphate isomerase A n=1 Tax=Cohnella silvisoli TaxID=2873699 RepID=A0ABV1KY05_9BACL|nr:ribose-5-phosphate isomerase RpiA [Cohnella silvisoli]
MIAKRVAAEKAVELIDNGMVVGLGSGSTSTLAIRKIAEYVKNGLQITAVASSKNSEKLAKELGIPIIPFSEVKEIDITIDGADEVDHDMNLIKGGGGALLREKILAFNSKKFVVIIDESKLVNKLGQFPLPVEIVPFASELTLKHLEALNCKPLIRRHNDKEWISDNGNLIVDCIFNVINDPSDLNQKIRSIPGVVETGLFIGMTHTLIIGNMEGTTRTL